MILLALLLACGPPEGTLEGVVRSRAWERTVHLERFERVQEEGWQDELVPRDPVMPAEGREAVPGVVDIRDCRSAVREVRRVPDGTREVCAPEPVEVPCGTERACRVEDLPNGFAREVCEDVPKTCTEEREVCRQEPAFREEPVMGVRCTYDTWRWRRIDTRHAAGRDTEPRWPEMRMLRNTRVVREETYEVTVDFTENEATFSHTFRTDDPTFYAAHPVGSEVLLVRTADGGVRLLDDG